MFPFTNKSLKRPHTSHFTSNDDNNKERNTPPEKKHKIIHNFSLKKSANKVFGNDSQSRNTNNYKLHNINKFFPLASKRKQLPAVSYNMSQTKAKENAENLWV